MGKLILDLHAKAIAPEGKQMLELINESSNKLLDLVDAVLNYSRCDNLLKEDKTTIAAEELKKEIFSFFVVDKDIRIRFTIDCKEIIENRGALEQILINLIANAIKYNDKKIIEIDIHIKEIDEYYQFTVKDNGPGIDPSYHHKVFEMFEVAVKKDRYGNSGNGIGLATVKKLITRLGGTISIDSAPGKGATFIFTLKK
jgi:signal transduction histidine kinase